LERGKATGDVERLVERGGGGRHEAQMLGHPGERRKQGERFERGDGMAALQSLDRHVEHREVVGHEERVETAALQRPGKAFHMVEIEVGIREGAGIAPSAGMDARRPHESAESQLP
jgi:hypothetical protein